MGNPEYESFLESKSQLGSRSGFKPLWIPDFLFDFQAATTAWNIEMARSADFLDCGLGKTAIQLVWAENVVRHTNKPVLIATPLAVSTQTLEESEKFGIQVRRCQDGKVKHGDNILVTNYERLQHFNADDFSGMVCDESSRLKNIDGKQKALITEFMRTLPYRLLATATASPNDYIELGTSSEALGELGYLDMLNRFFKNDQHTIKPMRYTGHGNPRYAKPEGREHTDKWRFKGHAEIPFYRWVCSWARSGRKPSDLGNFSDSNFELPPLIENEYLVNALSLAPGYLFPMAAIGLAEQREERRRTIRERCTKVAELCQPYDSSWIGCQLDDEANMLAKVVPDCVQISGKDKDEKREEIFTAFRKGQIKRLVTKKKIGAWGLNFQHCQHIVTFPDHSFEQGWQFVRRCWRFGQKRPVYSDIVTTEGEQVVMENYRSKANQAEKLFTSLVQQMNNSQTIGRRKDEAAEEQIPNWLLGVTA